MSDTEEEGTFDKEAEREKLRKQLEREEENRRSTQHMSELLLKGATMTNKHCDSCGDPLFRYEGQEFCPTCGQGGDGQAQERDQQPPAQEGAGDGGTAAQESTGIDRVETGRPSGTSGAAESTGPETTEPVDSGSSDQPRSPQPSPQAGTAAAPTAGGNATDAGAAGDVGATGDAGANVSAARAALARKLAALARQAETTDDVGRSRELLAAAREAAEALAAIDAVGR